MITTESELARALEDTALAGRPTTTLAVPSSRPALAVEVGGLDVLESWRIARGLLDRTGRWPVAMTAWGEEEGTWSEQLAASAFSRFEFRSEASGRGDALPGDLLRAADGVDLDAALSKLEALTEPLDPTDLLLEETREDFGDAPTSEDVGDARRADGSPLTSRPEAERWLFDWEIDRFGERALAEPAMNHISWFDPSPQVIALVLLPTMRSSDALAFEHWYGALAVGTPFAIALLRRWEERWGAELVAHWGTMLQLVVSRRPGEPEDAFGLALEQELIAPCTTLLPGVSLRDHARTLLHADAWFIHERP